LRKNDLSSSIVTVSENPFSTLIAELADTSTISIDISSSAIDNHHNQTIDKAKNESIKVTNPYTNIIPQASIFFSKVTTTTGIAVTAIIGLAYGESYWLITLFISESKKFKSTLYLTALAATIFHVLNLLFYTVVMDYQLSPYLMGDQGIGTWALLCGVMSNVINILIYWFIILRLYTFMKVIIICNI
jgi:hypothetical protein